ncbi:MAG: hypothetical protein NT109_07090 [Flavobacteriia bacterium]|nr:hypothetical protein [Flavobacteriia bacterium]
MRYLNYLVFSFFVLALFSCGRSEICDCIDLNLELAKEIEAANGEPLKIRAISDQYGIEAAKCMSLLKNKTAADFNTCTSYPELLRITK